MNKTFKALTAILVASAFALGLSACNTIEGAGQDIQKGGQAIEKAAE